VSREPGGEEITPTSKLKHQRSRPSTPTSSSPCTPGQPSRRNAAGLPGWEPADHPGLGEHFAQVVVGRLAPAGCQPTRYRHKQVICVRSSLTSTERSITPNRRPEIVRAKDNVSAYSGA
jgi:hypothetical protein